MVHISWGNSLKLLFPSKRPEKSYFIIWNIPCCPERTYNTGEQNWELKWWSRVRWSLLLILFISLIIYCYIFDSLFLPPLPGKEKEKYLELLPPCPRICDPVNPTYNLYRTEIAKQKYKTVTEWSVMKEKIQDIDLSKTVEQIRSLWNNHCSWNLHLVIMMQNNYALYLAITFLKTNKQTVYRSI